MLARLPTDDLTREIIPAAIEVHRELGPGLLESVAALLPIHQAQLLTYLKLTGLPVGLIINFNVERLVDGVKRVINPSPDPKRAAAVGLPPAAR